MSTLTQDEAQALVDAAVARVNDELVTPLLLGICTLTAAISRDRAVGSVVASALHQQADGCAPAGRLLLRAMAHSASGAVEQEGPSTSGE